MTVPASALWFALDTAFDEIEQACVEARAAELALRSKAAETTGAALILPRTLTVAPEVTLDAQSGTRSSKAATLARDLAFREAHPDGANLVILRDRLRRRLMWLRGKLAEGLAEHEVYAALVPLVVYTDELLATVSTAQRARWQSLQSELYGIDNGGEYFYALAEERLTKQETHPLVFQVFYFCLRDGFVGMYEGDPTRREDYLRRLAERIPLPSPPVQALDEPLPRVELVSFPWRIYAVAGGAVAALWLVLAAIGALS